MKVRPNRSQKIGYEKHSGCQGIRAVLAALFRWGVALQQRSRLRPRNSKEKVKLLEQARRIYEDALQMDSANPRVREALSSCMSELRYRNPVIY
ncbi:hypothetical protein SAY87_011771 [Trapa incisa]|uniref:Uncharacterized protein n=1 Tax=Trapa incisa TaxID=236973 RepID=A0AAN7GP89_9MYRT|nr:hypothetical protein SAY87_011771 [Trapa incisa]